MIFVTSPRSGDRKIASANPPPPTPPLADATCSPPGRAPYLPSLRHANHSKEHRQCAPSARRFTLPLHCSTRDRDALAGTRRGRREAEHLPGHAREAGSGSQDDRKPLLRMWQRLLVVQPIVGLDFLMALRSTDVSEHAAAVASRARAPIAGSAEGNLRIGDCISPARSVAGDFDRPGRSAKSPPAEPLTRPLRVVADGSPEDEVGRGRREARGVGRRLGFSVERTADS